MIAIADPRKIVLAAIGMVIGQRPVSRYSETTEHYRIAAVMSFIRPGSLYPRDTEVCRADEPFDLMTWCQANIPEGGDCLLWVRDLPITCRFLGVLCSIGHESYKLGSLYFGEKQRFITGKVAGRGLHMVDMLNFTDHDPDQTQFSKRWPLTEWENRLGVHASSPSAKALRRSVVTLAALMQTQELVGGL